MGHDLVIAGCRRGLRVRHANPFSLAQSGHDLVVQEVRGAVCPQFPDHPLVKEQANAGTHGQAGPLPQPFQPNLVLA